MLAKRKGIKLSHYVRSVVIEQTMGHLPYDELLIDTITTSPGSEDENND
jgi:hypothetical protein